MGEEKAPLSKGDSPLRGEMSRSDRGVRARRAVRVSGLGDSDGPPGRMALPECGPEGVKPCGKL